MGSQYSANKNIRFKTPVLRSDLYDDSDAYVVVKRRITVTGDINGNTKHTKLAFNNNAPFRSCISKINNTFIDISEDLDIVIPMYNLLEHSDNYYLTSGSLWNYYEDEVNDNDNDVVASFTINNNKATTSRSFEHKTKITGAAAAIINRLYT